MSYRAAAAGLAAAFVFAGAAHAAPANATSSLNVRSGPSTGYGVVDVLRPGERVDVRECRSNGWCFIVHDGPDGWVSSNYLTGIGGAPRRDNDPDVDVEFDINVPGFSFSFGNDDPRRFPGWRRPGAGNRDLVCLVTFERRDQVAAGRDADVVRAQLVTRGEAARRDGPNDRQGTFDYGSNAETRRTCNYLDRLN
jgi:uncharacterized protein YraI